jgi:hypothetical protein
MDETLIFTVQKPATNLVPKDQQQALAAIY